MMRRTQMVVAAVLMVSFRVCAMESKHKRVASESVLTLAKSLGKELVLTDDEGQKPVVVGLPKLSGISNAELLQEAAFNSSRKDERLLQQILSRLLLGQAIQEGAEQGLSPELEEKIREYDDLADAIKKNV